MRKRVRHLKGVMDIQSNSAGTKIAVKLPISKMAEQPYENDNGYWYSQKKKQD